jgi:hypothetical protein
MKISMGIDYTMPLQQRLKRYSLGEYTHGRISAHRARRPRPAEGTLRLWDAKTGCELDRQIYLRLTPDGPGAREKCLV